MLTQYFPPEMGAPQARLSELGDRLKHFGWSVEVLTALPNYPEGKVRKGYQPLKPVVEEIAGMRTVRVPLYPAQKGFTRRVASYMSFASSAAVFGPALCKRPDLLFVESPPLFIGFGALALSAAFRRPYVFNVSDLWPESAIRMGVVKPGTATMIAERFEETLYRRAAGVTGQSSEILDEVRRKAPQVPTELVTNGVTPGRWGKAKSTPQAKALLGDEPGPVFVFAGLLGLAQGLDAVLDLMKGLDASVPGRAVLIGDGPVRAHLEQRVRDEKISRVKLVPAQPREAIPALLASADVALISLGMDIPGAVPSKIYEAMASELPILLVASGEAARRVTDAKAGLAVKPGDATALRAQFERLARDPALRAELAKGGRRAAETLYDRDHIAERLDRFLRGLIARR